MDIYSQLFRYRETAKRAPLEDFLSEALVNLLGRMPQSIQANFVASLLRGNAGAPTMPGSWHWSTQRRIVHQGVTGILDMLLEVDGEPFLIIENKIASRVRAHSDDDEGEAGNQLRTYGRWLAEQRGNSSGALVLLTHTARPPQDFRNDAARYGVDMRSVASWAEVAAWLRRTTDDVAQDAGRPAWFDLANELFDFLEANELAANMMTQGDLAALELFIPAKARIDATIQKLWDETSGVRKGFCSRKIHDLTVEPENGLIWSWVYTVAPLPPSAWIAMGIGFPSQSSWLREAGLSPHRQIFMSISADDDALELDALGTIPTGWTIAGDQIITCLPLHELPAQADDLAHAMVPWATERMAQAIDILKRFVV